MKKSMIVAIGKNNEIGYKNKLLWHVPEDLKNFKKITEGHHVFMGRKTYDSIINRLGKVLPNRVSLVLTHKDVKDGKKVSSFKEALKIAKEAGDDEIFVIGGESIYRQTLNEIDKLYLTKVPYFGKADAYFPEINLDEFELTHSREGEECKFYIFERRAPKEEKTLSKRIRS